MTKFLTLIVTFFLMAAPAAMACVGCKDPGKAVDEPQTVMAGIAFSWSVMFLLAMVFLTLGGMVTYMVKMCQEHTRRHQEG